MAVFDYAYFGASGGQPRQGSGVFEVCRFCL
jgi:hypothetical protein